MICKNSQTEQNYMNTVVRSPWHSVTLTTHQTRNYKMNLIMSKPIYFLVVVATALSQLFLQLSKIATLWIFVLRYLRWGSKIIASK